MFHVNKIYKITSLETEKFIALHTAFSITMFEKMHF